MFRMNIKTVLFSFIVSFIAQMIMVYGKPLQPAIFIHCETDVLLWIESVIWDDLSQILHLNAMTSPGHGVLMVYITMAVPRELVRAGPFFNLWLSKVSANERRRYRCNVFSHWLRPCSVGDGKVVILTHWGRVMHICIGKLTIGSNDSLSPGRCQAIIWTNAGVLLIGPLWTNFSEILFEIYTFLLKKRISKCRLENGGHFLSASKC